jgi:hypothetical protein
LFYCVPPFSVSFCLLISPVCRPSEQVLLDEKTIIRRLQRELVTLKRKFSVLEQQSGIGGGGGDLQLDQKSRSGFRALFPRILSFDRSS